MLHKPLHIRIRSGDILYLLHLPATGGGAFFGRLAHHFSPETVLSLPDWPLTPDDVQYTPAAFVGKKLVRGHFDYEFCHVLPRTPLYLTWLREPVARVIALHQQITQHADHSRHQELGHLSLTEFVAHPAFALEGRNTQTRRLAGSAFPADQTVPDEVLLEMAQVNLDEMAFFGLAAQPGLSMRLLAYTFGWPLLKPTPEMHLNPVTLDTLAPDTLAAIREQNQLDIALYTFAQTLFEGRVHQMVDELLAQQYAFTPATPPSPPTEEPELPGPAWFNQMRRWRWHYLPEGTRRGRVYQIIRHPFRRLRE